MRSFTVTMAPLFAAILLFTATEAHAQKLVKAEFWSHTNGDNKDHDTGLYVKVVTNDESICLAEIENADNSGDDSTEYRDYSDHTVELVIHRDGATLEQCRRFKFKVGIRAHGNDRWLFRGKVILYFNNGQSLYEEIGDSELNSRGSRYVESGSDGGR